MGGFVYLSMCESRSKLLWRWWWLTDFFPPTTVQQLCWPLTLSCDSFLSHEMHPQLSCQPIFVRGAWPRHYLPSCLDVTCLIVWQQAAEFTVLRCSHSPPGKTQRKSELSCPSNRHQINYFEKMAYLSTESDSGQTRLLEKKKRLITQKYNNALPSKFHLKLNFHKCLNTHTHSLQPSTLMAQAVTLNHLILFTLHSMWESKSEASAP